MTDEPKLARVDALLELTKVLDRLENGSLAICSENNGSWDPVSESDEEPLLGALQALKASLRSDIAR